eukprot:TRINITY_DN67419_c6_g1_i1.p1 TRINITY_DN67419_c6_g1~~TRINITY_DN67419_c6_g1_i1.p1  ORF type:complete len:356 (-),score=28.15 TRINITY_DN67419_c6_g1_i1:381-1448(-)
MARAVLVLFCFLVQSVQQEPTDNIRPVTIKATVDGDCTQALNKDFLKDALAKATVFSTPSNITVTIGECVPTSSGGTTTTSDTTTSDTTTTSDAKFITQEAGSWPVTWEMSGVTETLADRIVKELLDESSTMFVNLKTELDLQITVTHVSSLADELAKEAGNQLNEATDGAIEDVAGAAKSGAEKITDSLSLSSCQTDAYSRCIETANKLRPLHVQRKALYATHRMRRGRSKFQTQKKKKKLTSVKSVKSVFDDDTFEVNFDDDTVDVDFDIEVDEDWEIELSGEDLETCNFWRDRTDCAVQYNCVNDIHLTACKAATTFILGCDVRCSAATTLHPSIALLTAFLLVVSSVLCIW